MKYRIELIVQNATSTRASCKICWPTRSGPVWIIEEAWKPILLNSIQGKGKLFWQQCNYEKCVVGLGQKYHYVPYWALFPITSYEHGIRYHSSHPSCHVDPLILLIEALHLDRHHYTFFSLMVFGNNSSTPSPIVLCYMDTPFLKVNIEDYHF